MVVDSRICAPSICPFREWDQAGVTLALRAVGVRLGSDVAGGVLGSPTGRVDQRPSISDEPDTEFGVTSFSAHNAYVFGHQELTHTHSDERYESRIHVGRLGAGTERSLLLDDYRRRPTEITSTGRPHASHLPSFRTKRGCPLSAVATAFASSRLLPKWKAKHASQYEHGAASSRNRRASAVMLPRGAGANAALLFVRDPEVRRAETVHPDDACAIDRSIWRDSDRSNGQALDDTLQIVYIIRLRDVDVEAGRLDSRLLTREYESRKSDDWYLSLLWKRADLFAQPNAIQRRHGTSVTTIDGGDV